MLQTVVPRLVAASSWVDLVMVAAALGVAARLPMRAGLVGGLAAWWGGSFCNLIAVAANGWQMPAETGRIPFLIDRFDLGWGLGIGSIGDFLVWGGDLACALALAVSVGSLFIGSRTSAWSERRPAESVSLARWDRRR